MSAETEPDFAIEQEALSAISFQPGVEAIDDGYALCDRHLLTLVYCNSTFRKWFDVHELHNSIDQVINNLKSDILLKRLAKRGTYTFAIESEQNNQGIPALVEVSFKPLSKGDAQYIAVHARNMTKLLEKDALIQSHSHMIEQSNRQLARLTKRLEAENGRLSSELEVTRKLQQFLIPTKAELSLIDTLDIACFMEPADEIGGDYYDVLQHEHGVRIGIGDVTGHGLESGVIMLMVQMGIRTLLASKETDAIPMLSILNQAIFDNVTRMGTDKSLSLAILDYQDGKVRVTGQHEEIIVVRKGGAIERLDTIELGFPIGLVDDIAHFIDETHIHLQPGDGIVLYTDGITEAENMAKEQYEMERLCAVINKNWSKSADAICNAITSDVYHFIGEQNIYDDITLLVIKQA